MRRIPQRARNRSSGDALPQAGISESLASQRATRVSDLRYALSLTIPVHRLEPITGQLAITFTLRDAAAPLSLDFAPNQMGRLHGVSCGGVPLDAPLLSGHLIIPAAALRSGSNLIAIAFDAGDGPLNRIDDFLYTLFVPARAHETFPCFDQPDLKGRWTLTLDVAADWEAVANGAETARTSHGGRTRITFAETAPLSTYLFAFAAGRLSVEQGERRGRRFRMWHRETDPRTVERNRDAIFDLHAMALEWLERYTGLPYPFGKFDLVLVPSLQFAGMEHPGAVLYDAEALLLGESATENDRLDRASLIAHETSHMWFGNLVTMTWFGDVWLKEVFASFLAARIVELSFPGVNHSLRFLHGHYPRAYDIDRTAGSHAIRQRLDNLQDAGSLYDSIIYQKAPIVIRELEGRLGAEAFRDGVREYLHAHQFGNAAWPDLLLRLGARLPSGLAAWSRAWIDEGGRPIVRTELTVTGDRISELAFTSHDARPGRELIWTQDLRLVLGYEDRVEFVAARLDGVRTVVPAACGRPAPLFVLANGGGVGYGEFHLDRASLEWLSQRLPNIGDPLIRGSAWLTLWDSLLCGELTGRGFLDLAVRALPRETDALNVQHVLSLLVRAYWTFTPDADRADAGPAIERLLREQIIRTASTGLQAAYFVALRGIAQTHETLEWLSRIWRGEETVAGLALAEADFVLLAQSLAIREVSGSSLMLEQQIARTMDPDRRARLRFVTPALSADSAERGRFFTSLALAENRRHERWVVDGLRCLHHPLRQAASVAYIDPSLQLLREIQETGDIFFPARWMDATLSGHRSPQAAAIVRAFLAGTAPLYPERLRRIVLAAADQLFRASGAE